MSSGTKRKVEELGGHVLSAAVGDVVTRTMSAAVGRYKARASVDDQLDRLDMLLTTVHSAIEAAESVHVRSWWLRRWLWRLRDAALDGDEVLRLFRQRREAAEETDAASRQLVVTGRNMVWRALRSVKSRLFGRGDDGGVERLRRMVARLEREAMGLGDFLKVLDLETRRSLAVQPEPEQEPSESFYCTGPGESLNDKQDKASPVDGSGFDHGVSPISREEYVAGVRKMGLLILRRRILRALDRLIIRKKPAAATPALTPEDTHRLRELVARIQRAAVLSTDWPPVDETSQRIRFWKPRKTLLHDQK